MGGFLNAANSVAGSLAGGGGGGALAALGGPLGIAALGGTALAGVDMFGKNKKAKEAEEEEKKARKRKARSDIMGSIGQAIEEGVINKKLHDERMMMIRQFMAQQGGGRS